MKINCIWVFSKQQQKKLLFNDIHCPELPLKVTAMKTDWLDLSYNCNLTSENELNWEEFTDYISAL